MSGYTPGPWRAETNVSAPILDVIHCVENDGRAPICGVFINFLADGQNEANARLIAAAPELLEALIKMVSVAERDNWQAAISGRQAFLWDAKVAIAKARGEA